VAVPQFWDGEQLLGFAVSRSLGMTPDYPAWDIYLFYPPGAKWTEEGLPRPEKAIAQAMGVVIGMKGTLPPKGDQSRAPDWGKGSIDVVGEHADLGDLLAAIAVPYVEQHKKGR